MLTFDHFRIRRLSKIGLLGFTAILSTGALWAEVRLPSVFSDGMVLQRDREIPVWGWDTPGQKIEVRLNGQSAEGITLDDGRWQVRLKPEPAGGPHELTVGGSTETVVHDVLIGEVWVCSGQSNMEWKVHSVVNSEDEIASANWPEIRMFTVAKKVSDVPLDDVVGDWQKAISDNVGGFSAVGYFFGREVHRALKVPVGLIHTSWGGTPAEAWMSRRWLEADQDFMPIVDRYQKALHEYPEAKARWDQAVEKLKDKADAMPVYHVDTGNEGERLGWANPDLDVADWSVMGLPGYLETVPGMQIDGAVWFRRFIQIPGSWSGKDLQLELGPIDDFDTTYFNGAIVGSTGIDTPGFYAVPRRYRIPGSLVKEGTAVIAVRVFDHFGNGGFAGYPAQMKLGPAEEGEPPLKLAGDWSYKVERELDPSAVSGPGGQNLPPEPMGPGHSHSPEGLYNGMLLPLAPYALAGAIWYQGETNAGRGHQYRKLLAAMIQNWREVWGQGDLPFGIVQLANFMPRQEQPGESDWAELREAQAMVSTDLPNVGLAITIDIGEADDIHPRNKQDVGARLAKWALADIYGKHLEPSGPRDAELEVVGSQARIRFKHTAAGLVARGGELKGFAVAGEDRQFHWAKARIEGDIVVVETDAVSGPIAVRYGWANNPECNLYNSEGLPAVPFRTDTWPGNTLNRR